MMTSFEAGASQDNSSCVNSTYLTPTQRKNQEIKRLRLELERVNTVVASKDKEIVVLKKEIAALKESQKPSNLNDSWIAETESAADSGNCEELPTWDGEDQEQDTNQPSDTKIDNIDFELMESALREEEEYRQKLEEDNQELTDKITELKAEIEKLNNNHEDELNKIQSTHSEDVIDARKESNQKLEELIIELAESSMRCARQQDTIEQRQLKIDGLLKEISENKAIIAKLENIVEENKTKDISEVFLEENKVKYLNANQTFCQEACQTESNTKDNTTQTENVPDTKVSELLHRAQEPLNYDVDCKEAEAHKKSESTCDNKIHYTYQFLRRSIYYYITDKDNRAYHLRSIQRLLEFSDAELNNVKYSQQPFVTQPVKRY